MSACETVNSLLEYLSHVLSWWNVILSGAYGDSPRGSQVLEKSLVISLGGTTVAITGRRIQEVKRLFYIVKSRCNAIGSEHTATYCSPEIVGRR